MITLEPALRRRHGADGCPEPVLDELMQRLRYRFEQKIYPELFMGPVLNLDVEYAKGNNGTSLSHFVWDFFPEMCRFMLRNPVACENTEGTWEIRTRSEEEVESEIQRIPACQDFRYVARMMYRLLELFYLRISWGMSLTP